MNVLAEILADRERVWEGPDGFELETTVWRTAGDDPRVEFLLTSARLTVTVAVDTAGGDVVYSDSWGKDVTGGGLDVGPVRRAARSVDRAGGEGRRRLGMDPAVNELAVGTTCRGARHLLRASVAFARPNLCELRSSPIVIANSSPVARIDTTPGIC